MAVIRCKMCGGDLKIIEGASTAECAFCGSIQTIPKVDDEKKLTLFARAGRLRAACEFDKAAGIYEAIAADFPEEAESYWGLVLCKYGIEYVDDPATGRMIPTCHRSSFDSIMNDSDFEQALENADVMARRVYREEAKQIEEIRKGIIAVSANEQPYDIFICYKDTDENGGRTLDSVLAQDIYEALTEKGYRVFFSRITLEDKLGVEYEPYIFAALNSAKIMLAVGTDYEYYNAVWVKNEWSRYLKLMAQDRNKHLIPCFKNLDAYDMPKEFAKLQAQDLSKVGAMQDLLRGIEKLMPKKADSMIPIQQNAADMGALDMRGQFALDDGDFAKAEEYFERALDQNPMDGAAYLGKVLAMLHLSNVNQINDHLVRIHDNKDFDRAIQFSNPATSTKLAGIRDQAHKKYLVQCLTVELKKVLLKRQAQERNRLEAERKRQEAERKRQEAERIAEQKRLSAERCAKRRESIKNAICMICADGNHTVGVKTDGTVMAVGHNEYGQCRVSGWTDIVAVSAGDDHTVGLKSDGTVVAVGVNYDGSGQCNVTRWRDIVAVSAGSAHTVGLKSDGTVVAVGWNAFAQCEVTDWRAIVAVSAGDNYTVGLKSDGTVMAVGNNSYGQCDVTGWRDIVAVSAGWKQTVGLKTDGTVVAVGENDDGQCNVSDWRDIVAVSVSDHHTVGLKTDGTVVAVGDNEYGKCNVSDWRDIVAVSADHMRTVGLKSDGTVVAVGYYKDGQSDVTDWKLFQTVQTIEQEREEVNRRRKEDEAHREQLRKEEEARQAQSRIEEEARREQLRREEEARIEQVRLKREAKQKQWKQENRCQYCGGEFKGLFTKKCASCHHAKDY